MNVLFQGIYSKLAGSALNTAIGGRLYLKKAPQQATYPYVVYDLITQYDDLDFTDEIKTFQV